MKILFISRAYPPILGGIEMQNFGIAKGLSQIADVKIIANKKGKKNLLIFLPFLFLRLFFLLPKFDVVLFGDGVLTPIGAFLKLFFRKKKFVSIIHGLDITFAYKKSLLGKIYRAINIPSHKKMDKLIMVGNETIREAVKIGIDEKLCVFIPNGLDVDEIAEQHEKSDIEKMINIDLSGKKVIFRGGRFVKHKGVEWFIRNVMPLLPENYVLIAAGGIVTSKAGDPSDYDNCLKAVKEKNLGRRVKIMGDVSRKNIRILFNACDLYISPNIKVPGSMEGFGITAIEAGACGKAVLASNIEGLKDAITDGKNGFLVEAGNAEAYKNKIVEVLENDELRKEFGEKARQFVVDNYSWDKIAKRYLEEISNIISNK